MSMRDLLRTSALEQAARVRRGEVSCEELTRAYLSRIESLDPRFSAFVQLAPERAIASARKLDATRRSARSDTRSPLWGLPTGMKDIHLTRGFFSRLGSRAFKHFWSPVDDVSSAAVRRAGMVIMGKLSTSELAILPIVDTALHAPTRNPWDETRYSGGSSGGSSAAIASGMMPIAVASDGAGSIRIPAAFCGLVGHKTTRGLAPNPFQRFENIGLSVVGPHARTVDDACALLDVLTDRNAGADTFLARASRVPAPLRIRVTTENTLIGTDPRITTAVDEVARVLSGLGHHVEVGSMLRAEVEDFLPMFRFLVAGMFIPFERAVEPTTRWLRDAGRSIKMADAMALREDFRVRVDDWMGDADVYVTPTVPMAAPVVGAWSGFTPSEVIAAAAPYGVFTAPLNASGNPATSIPVFRPEFPHPIGVQFVGRRGEDATLLALSRVCLEAIGTTLMPWAEDRSSKGAPKSSASD